MDLQKKIGLEIALGHFLALDDLGDEVTVESWVNGTCLVNPCEEYESLCHEELISGVDGLAEEIAHALNKYRIEEKSA